MKTALHSVSYSGVWLGQAKLSLEDFITKAANLGYDGVMLMAKRPHLSPLDADTSSSALAKIKMLLEEHNLHLACLAAYTDFCGGSDRPDVPFREMQIIYVTELARITSELGGNLVRIFSGFEREGVSYDQQWDWCVKSIKECARRAADFGVTVGIQNHHDIAAHYESLYDLLVQVDEPNCKACFDAWALALQGSDLSLAVRKLGAYIVHTTVADYIRRPRFRYQPQLVNYLREADLVKAVPVGNGFIDYPSFFKTLMEIGYDGFVAYEMCSSLEGGGSLENLDRCAKLFLDYMNSLNSSLSSNPFSNARSI